MPPETTRVEGERDAGREQQLPDLEPGSPGAVCSRWSRTSSGVAGRTVASWNDEPSPSRTRPSPSAPRITTWARLCGSTGVGRGEVGSLVPADVEGHDLAEPAVGALLEHDVRAGLQLEAVQRRLIREAAPVDRGREREDLLLELPPDGPVAVEALLHVDRRVAHLLTRVGCRSFARQAAREHEG